MSGTHLIITEHLVFKDIPKTEYTFEDVDKIMEALDKLYNENFNVNLFLDISNLSEEELENILNLNKKYKTYILNKKDKYKKYKKEIEVSIK
jgi:adenine C2-methylase RlmN of 23S rRNA A2503 and tRNA A37